ncbi:MAG: AAA family ATPase [Chloroflexaceae bacterium]|nr:AAA family ATPase [Chloroflexaceae bacterium]
MTTYVIDATETFLNELLGIPRNAAHTIIKKREVLRLDPYLAGNQAKMLKGYDNVYRLRVGDYRILYLIGTQMVRLLSVRKRDDAYKKNINEERDELLDLALFEDLVPTAPPPTPFAPSITIEPPAPEQPRPLPQPITPAPEQPRPLPQPITPAMLEQLHIPPEHWPALLTIQNEDQLIEAEEHVLHKYVTRLLDNLFPPKGIAKLVSLPAFDTDQDEQLERWVAGDLYGFLLRLDPEQEQLAEMPTTGAVLVKGGPGTGKSTVALYRVRWLLNQGFERILFTTYTNALAQYSAQLLEHLLGGDPADFGVQVSTIDRLSVYYADRNGCTQQHCTDVDAQQILDQAIRTAALSGSRTLAEKRRQQLQQLGSAYLLDEIKTVIEGWGVSSADEYVATSRRGRRTQLAEAMRRAFWEVYTHWAELMQQRGWALWQQKHRHALHYVTTHAVQPYDAIIIDEAQDLSPVLLRFLVSLVEHPKGIYLTADANQSIYQRGFSWQQVHADLHVRGRTSILRRNYRNTRQIIAACTHILPHDGTDEPPLEPSLREGNPPQLFLSEGSDLAAETRALLHFFRTAARQHRLAAYSGAVLCPTKQIAKETAAALTAAGLEATYFESRNFTLGQACIKVITYHTAKGLEFPFVAVLGLTDGRMPLYLRQLPPDEQAAHVEEQRRLFYVACSRAMLALLVCGSATSPSSFLANLDPPDWEHVS